LPSFTPARNQVKKLASIRELFEVLVGNCLRNYSPSELVTIDQILTGFKGKCPFRQYIFNKLVKYGIKMQAMTDERTDYVCKMKIYQGQVFWPIHGRQFIKCCGHKAYLTGLRIRQYFLLSVILLMLFSYHILRHFHHSFVFYI